MTHQLALRETPKRSHGVSRRTFLRRAGAATLATKAWLLSATSAAAAVATPGGVLKALVAGIATSPVTCIDPSMVQSIVVAQTRPSGSDVSPAVALAMQVEGRLKISTLGPQAQAAALRQAIYDPVPADADAPPTKAIVKQLLYVLQQPYFPPDDPIQPGSMLI